MKKKLALAVWPNQTGYGHFGAVNYGYFGAVDYLTPHDSCGSIMLNLRLLSDEDTSDYTYNYIGLYIWFSDKQLLIEPRLHGVHTMGLHELTKSLKIVKAMAKKLKGGFQAEPTYKVLIDTFTALGIKESFEYAPIVRGKFGPVPLVALTSLIDGYREKFKERIGGLNT